MIINRFVRYILFLGVIFLIINMIASYFTINFTPSYPVGLYFQSSFNEIKKNHYYLFCPTYDKYMQYAESNNFWKNLDLGCGKTPIYLKKAIGMPGDMIFIKSEGVYVNGVIVPNTQIVLKNNIFKKDISYQLKDNQYFMLSDYNKYSYDSRYYGIIEKKQILKEAYPILTKEVIQK